jgi:hypothetical protein
MSKFGDSTLKQDLYEYLSALKNDYEVSQIILCREVGLVLAALIEDISIDASIASIIATAKYEERNRIRNTL